MIRCKLLPFPVQALTLIWASLSLTACGSEARQGSAFTPDAGTSLADGGSTPTGDTGVITTPPLALTECPKSGSLTVCDLKLFGSARQPARDEPITLKGVVATTAPFAVSTDKDTQEVKLWGLFVQDPSLSPNQYAGVQVVFDPSLVESAPAEGDVVDIEGQYSLFGPDGGRPQAQVRVRTFSTTGHATVSPVAFASPELLAQGTSAEAYEGMLVQVSNVTATKLEVPSQSGSGVLFDAFEIDNTLVVSTEITTYRVQASEGFERITGVLRLGTSPFSAGLYLLTPRKGADIESKTPRVFLSSIPEIHQKPDHCTNNDQADSCVRARLSNVVVTAVGGYENATLRSLWAQDASIKDGRNAGIKIIYAKDDARYRPKVGENVDVEGRIQRYYGALQIYLPEILKGSGTSTITPVVVTSADLAAEATAGSNPYEGALVKVVDVEVTSVCIADQNGKDRGNWGLGDQIFVGSAFDYDYNGDLADCSDNKPCACDDHARPDDMRTKGDRFESVTGVVNYAYDRYRLEPRNSGDLKIAR
ncbi:MAG: hypothetical protein IPK13_22645 [Deltaproteobacteria bacterium]|nr:hypothetical protein [Deltaproteobacteria bacterium]